MYTCWRFFFILHNSTTKVVVQLLLLYTCFKFFTHLLKIFSTWQLDKSTTKQLCCVADFCNLAIFSSSFCFTTTFHKCKFFLSNKFATNLPKYIFLLLYKSFYSSYKGIIEGPNLARNVLQIALLPTNYLINWCYASRIIETPLCLHRWT